MCKRIKKFFIIILIVMFSFAESICATSINNNDGSAFITKAEFDSLKSSFQSQIDSYNQGIDSKIDGAIASYLSGISINKEMRQTNIYTSIGKDIMFGNIPSVSTSVKYNVNYFASLLAQGDGYTGEGTIRIHVRYFYGNSNWTSGTGTYNLFQTVNGFNCFYGKTVGEYCNSSYSFSGDIMVPTETGAFVATVPAGTNTVGGSKEHGTDDKTIYGWNGATDLIEWYSYQPTTAGWGQKKTYFTRIDGYTNGTITSYNDIMASGEVSTSDYNMIDFDNRTQCAEDKVLTRTDTWNCNTQIMTQQLGLSKFSMQVPVKYYFPTTSSKKFSELNNFSIAQALNIGMPLYGGVPLFKATDDGTVTVTFKMNTTNATAATQAYFALVDGGLDGDRCFANADTFSTSVGGGDVKFDAWDVMSDGTETKFATDAYYVYSFVDGRKLKIQFKADKGHTYVFKMKPSALDSSGTNIYAYASDFGDIMIKKDES